MTSTWHVSSEDLVIYALEKTDPESTSIVEKHLVDCPECLMGVLMLRELRDLESLGLLPHAEEMHLPWGLPEGLPSQEPKEKKGKLGEVFGLAGFGGALGLTQILGRHGSPALASHMAGSADDVGHHAEPTQLHDQSGDAAAHDTFSDETVRNVHHSSSEGFESEFTVPTGSTSSHEEMKRGMTHFTTHEDFQDAAKAFGTPAEHGTSDYVHQQYPDTCAVQCQHLILNQFGVDVSEDQLVREASERGIYSPGHGTALDDVGKLLELHGIPVHRDMDANVFNLAIELSEGHKVIVGLDSGELWHTHTVLQSISETFGIGQADHAVIVSGIDTTDPDHPRVIVTDPGTGDIAKSYQLNDFLDAWKGSNFSMVSTTLPAPLEFNPEMVNFDYDAGHIPAVGPVPYDLVHDMADSAAQESDPTALQKLENIFVHVIDGDISIGDILAGLTHDNPAHHSLSDLASHLVSIAQGGFAAGAVVSLFESFPDIGITHEASVDSHYADSHYEDISAHHDLHAESDPTHHQDVQHDSDILGHHDTDFLGPDTDD